MMRNLTYVFLAGALMTLTPLASASAAQVGCCPCVVTYDPSASSLEVLPPKCIYESNKAHITQGPIPFNLKIKHRRFLNIALNQGGSLGGFVETFNSDLIIEVGEAAVTVPAAVVVSTAPFEDSVDAIIEMGGFVSFATSMDQLAGESFGDEIFEYFSIRAGSDLGQSPGQTTITLDPETETAVVDSIFNIPYVIEFEGRGGGPLDGFGGVFEGTVTMEAFALEGSPCP